MNRRYDVEFLRIVSTFLVVWYHCPSSFQEFAYSGLIFFVVVSVYFATIHADAKWREVVGRIGRLILVWFFWYCVYLALLVVGGGGRGFFDGPVISMALVGPAVHLWYLPFLVFAMVVIRMLAPVLPSPVFLCVVSLFYVASMVFVEVWRPWSMTLDVPWAQYLHALPGALVGILFAGIRDCDWRIRLAIVSGAFLATLPAWHAVGVGETYFFGLILVLPILFAMPGGRLVERAAYLSKYMLGIYLLHPIVIRVLRRLLGGQDICLAAVSFAVALIVVMAVYSRMPRFAKVVM